MQEDIIKQSSIDQIESKREAEERKTEEKMEERWEEGMDRNLENSSHPSTVQQDSPALPPPSIPSAKVGGWRAIKYILGNEAFEKLASMSLIANITVYLKTKYNMEGILLVNVISIWSGSSNITSIVGAFISDAYLGRFRTLLFGSIASLLGMGMMTLTAAIPQLTPPACADETHCIEPQISQLGFLFGALGLLAIGAGGIRPCNIAFGADQFDTRTEKGRAGLESFFNWWYFSFTAALLIALTAVVYIQTNVSWVVGFAIPTGCFVLSISIFLFGKCTYILMKPQGSVFSDMFRVITAACKKRKLTAGAAAEHNFYNPPMIDQDPHFAKLAHTERFRFLDKAAMITDPSELDNQGMPKNSWRLCSLQQVEQLKCLLGILPVWLSGIGCLMAMDQQNSFGILQAIQMNKRVGSHFQVPPGWMGLTSMIALSTWIFVYERIYLPQARKMAKKDKRLTMKQRINTGIVMAILCMLVAGVVEKQRRDSALKHGTFESPLSAAFLLPQFALSGMTEAFAAVAIMEFLSTQLPESLRTVAGAIFFLSLSIASYLSSFFVNITHAITGRNDRPPWLGGNDLNKNRLDYYYYIIAGLGAINFIYFNSYASRCVVNNHYKSEPKDEEKGLETKEP